MTDKEAADRIARLLAKADNNVGRLVSAMERELIQNYKQALDSIRLQIAKMVEKYGDKAQYADLVAYNRLTNIETAIAEELKVLQKSNVKIISSGIKDIYSQSFYQAGFAYETTIGAKLGFTLLSTKAIESSVLNSLDRIGWPARLADHVQKLNNAIRQEITQGLIQGKGYASIAKGIKDATDISAGKATLIARTEAHRVQSAGKILAFDKTKSAGEKLGIKLIKVWVATLDPRTRDHHRDMDGKEADEDGLFTFLNGAKVEGPGLTGIASEDINCRCTTITQIQGVEQLYRKDNVSKEIISYKNYQEWFENRIQ